MSEEKKYAYQLDQYGIYLGLAERQASPLEPGVWLIPGGCVIEPTLPTLSEGQFARLVSGTWQIITEKDVEQIRNVYQINNKGFFMNLQPKELFVQSDGSYIFPDNMVQNPQLPVIPENQFARLVEGAWEFYTQEQYEEAMTSEQ